MRELQALEEAHAELRTPDSPTQRVGGQPREGFVKVPHSSPMLSLDNALNEQELREFDNRIQTLLKDEAYEYVAELKLDGLSDGDAIRRWATSSCKHARRRASRRGRHRQCAHHSLSSSPFEAARRLRRLLKSGGKW